MATKAQVEAEYAAFRKKVEARIKEAIASEEICREGGNKALRDFGFPPNKESFDGYLTVSVNVENFMATEERYGGMSEVEISPFIDAIINAIEAVDAAKFGGEQCTVSAEHYDSDFDYSG